MVGYSISVGALSSCMSPPWLLLRPRSESALTDTPWCGCHWHQWLWWPPCHSLAVPPVAVGCSQRADRDSLQGWLWMSPARGCLHRQLHISFPSQLGCRGMGEMGNLEQQISVVHWSTAPTFLLPQCIWEWAHDGAWFVLQAFAFVWDLA